MKELGIEDFKQIPEWVHHYFAKYSYSGSYFNEFVELTFYKNEFGTLYLQCRNIEIVDTLLFMVPIPADQAEFITLMKILKV